MKANRSFSIQDLPKGPGDKVNIDRLPEILSKSLAPDGQNNSQTHRLNVLTILEANSKQVTQPQFLRFLAGEPSEEVKVSSLPN